MTAPPDQNLKALWKGQETETAPMSVEAIRARADAYQQKVRASYVIAVVIVVLCGAVFAWLAAYGPNTIYRLGSLIEITFVPWWIWRMRHRWPVATPGDRASAERLLVFHRDQIVRRRDSFLSVMILVAPIFIGMGVEVIGLWPRVAAHWSPLLALMALWFVLLLFLLRRRHRKLQAQLDELDRLGG